MRSARVRLPVPDRRRARGSLRATLKLTSNVGEPGTAPPARPRPAREALSPGLKSAASLPVYGQGQAVVVSTSVTCGPSAGGPNKRLPGRGQSSPAPALAGPRVDVRPALPRPHSPGRRALSGGGAVRRGREGRGRGTAQRTLARSEDVSARARPAHARPPSRPGLAGSPAGRRVCACAVPDRPPDFPPRIE